MNRTIVTLLIAATALRADAQEQSRVALTWSARVPTGGIIRIRDLSGDVNFGPASGDRVEVTATEHWRRGDPASVHFDTVTASGGQDVSVCALWGDARRCNDNNEIHGRNNNNNDVSVSFRVLVPKGVRISGETINGSVDVTGATTDVSAGAVNGHVSVATERGTVSAKAVNGEAIARIGHVDATSNITIESVNGAVVADLPSDLSADITLETVNGSLKSDFDITVSGRVDPRRIRAHVGPPGGTKLSMKTVNGNVTLRRH